MLYSGPVHPYSASLYHVFLTFLFLLPQYHVSGEWRQACIRPVAKVAVPTQHADFRPMLFSLYIDDLIAHLKSCGYGIHVGSLFVGCVLYADDIVLLSASCQGLQQLINLCVKYGERWDIRFNPLKSHAVTVGDNNPHATTLQTIQ